MPARRRFTVPRSSVEPFIDRYMEYSFANVIRDVAHSIQVGSRTPVRINIIASPQRLKRFSRSPRIRRAVQRLKRRYLGAETRILEREIQRADQERGTRSRNRRQVYEPAPASKSGHASTKRQNEVPEEYRGGFSVDIGPPPSVVSQIPKITYGAADYLPNIFQKPTPDSTTKSGKNRKLSVTRESNERVGRVIARGSQRDVSLLDEVIRVPPGGFRRASGLPFLLIKPEGERWRQTIFARYGGQTIVRRSTLGIAIERYTRRFGVPIQIERIQ